MLASYVHMMRLLILSLYENRKTAHARGARARIFGSHHGDRQRCPGLDIADEVYGMNDRFADGATAGFCITLPQNSGPVRAMELK